MGEGEGVMYDMCRKVSCPASCNRLLLINVFPDCVATISNTFQGENNFKSKNLQHSQNITFRFEYCQSRKLPQLVKVQLIQYNTIQYNTIQYSTVQYNIRHAYNTMQCNTSQNRIKLHFEKNWEKWKLEIDVYLHEKLENGINVECIYTTLTT